MLSNNEEPPPYLVVGTEVSAKFKGAFCEAKITRVDKNVRCKITYKNSNQQVTVSDEQIRSISTGKALAFNEFKIGTLVDVIKSNENNNNEQQHEAAMLNKILDQSSYTVVFNDGDEKILKRTFIRFKGEKHYLDSETLNNAPLNNPEHFLYPIKQHNNNNNNATDQVALSPSTTIKTSNSSAKSSPNNLPKRTSNQTDDEESIDEEDSTHLSKPPEAKKPKKNIKRRTISKDEIETEAQEEERIAHDLQQQSDGGGDDRDSGTESDSSSSSDDYPSEIKDRFVAQLYKFMDDRGTPMNRLPTINCVDIDLHRFFIVVRKYGGFNKVCKLGNWINVYKRLNLPNVSHSSNVANLRSAYKRYLQPFEDFYRKLGSTMLDLVSKHVVYNTNSAKRNTSDSHRSLQLFKNRVLTPSSQKKGLSKFKQKQAAAAAAISSANSTSPLTTASVTPTITANIDSSLNDTIQQRKESIDSVADLAEFKQTNDLLQQTQQQEEITLSSMVRNLNENFKKAKRQEKEKKLTIVDDSDTQSKDTNEPKISNQQLPSTSTPAGSSGSSHKKITLTKTKQQQTPTSETTKLLSKKKPSSSSVSSTSSSSSSSSSNNKVTPLIEVDNNNNDFEEEEDEDDDSLDESKPKRKVNRLSASGSEETQTILDTKKKLGMKRKHSLTCSKSTNNTATSPSNTETNEDSDDLQTSLKETEYKTNLTINDLEVNKIVDVKYANGSQKREYKAKIVQINTDNQTVLVHYLGWNTRYDEWVKMDRIKRMVNENFNSHKRRKSNKLKTNNQKADSPSSSSSSHPNESPEKKEAINKNLNHKILLKKNERSSSSSTTSSLCDPVKDTETTTNENMKLNKFRNSGSTTISEVKTIDSNKSQLQIDSESQIEQTIDLGELKTPCDSLLSIKEEIIESENQEPIITLLPTNDDYSNNKDKLEPDPDKSSDNIKNVTPKTIERNTNNKKLNEPLKIIKTETNLNSSNSKLTLNVSPSIIDNQENNKSQTIKSPSLPSLKSSHDRQINQQQPQPQPVTSDKVLNNQTNCSNENHIILESEDDNKKKTDSKSQSLPANDECSNTISLKKSEVHSSQQHQQQQLISLENYKYSFNLNDVSLIGKQRIRYIEEQMRACREMYAKLKNEIAAIDRKKKKLKRSILETSNNKSGYLNSLACSSSSSNNDDSSVQYSNLKAHKN